MEGQRMQTIMARPRWLHARGKSHSPAAIGWWLKLIVLGAFGATAFGLMAPAAFADSLWGPWAVSPVGGVTYQHRSAVTVWADGTGATARTTLQTQSGQLVPAQWMWIYPRLYNGSNNIMREGPWYYNASPQSSVSAPTSPKRTNTGWYFGKGRFGLWDGTQLLYADTLASGLLHNPL